MTTYKSRRKNASRKARKGTRKIRVKRGGGGNPLHRYIRDELDLKQPHKFADIKFYGSKGRAIVIGEESMTSQEYNVLIDEIKRALKSLDKERKEVDDEYALWASDYSSRGVIDSTEQLKLEKIIRDYLKKSSPKSKTPSKSPKSKTPSKKSPSKK